LEAEDGGTILEEGLKVVEEISNWRTSRPNLITGLRDGPRLPLEEYVSSSVRWNNTHFFFSLLNTHDLALGNFMVGNHCLEFSTWRAPLVAAVGAFTQPHQDTNGVGATLYCTYRYKAFLLCYNARTPITLFPDVSDDIALGWEHLYHSPHKFGAFVLCPGQMP